MPKWCKRGVKIKTNPEKETNATEYFYKNCNFCGCSFCFFERNKTNSDVTCQIAK